MKTKKCFKCGKEQNVSEFYKHPQMADGRLGKCKICAKKDVNKHRIANIERIRAYDRTRGNRQSIEYSREYYRKNASKQLRRQQRFRKNYPDKYSARNILNNAIRTKRIQKEPCERCGSTKNIHGHHEDYAYPLTVNWLCRKHHGERHREINEIKREKENGNKSNQNIHSACTL